MIELARSRLEYVNITYPSFTDDCMLGVPSMSFFSRVFFKRLLSTFIFCSFLGRTFCMIKRYSVWFSVFFFALCCVVILSAYMCSD